MGIYKNPLTIYLLFWGIWLGISMLDPFRLYSVSDEAYLLLLANIACFSIGYVTFCNKVAFGVCSNSLFKKSSKLAIISLQFFLLIVLVYYIKKFNYLVAAMTISDARTIKFEQGLLFNSFTEYAFFNYFIHSFLYLTTILAISSYVVNKKINTILIFSIINVWLFGLIGLGRFVIFDTLVFYLLANSFMCHINSSHQIIGFKSTNYRKKIIFTIFGFSAVIAMVSLTASRMGIHIYNKQNIIYITSYTIEQAIVYFVGPFRAFDHFLNISDNFNYTLGRASFAGIEEIISNFFLFADIKWVTANEITSSFTTPGILVGQNQYFNAFYTGVMNSFLDGGLVGVMFFAFLFGAIAAGVLNYHKKHSNLFSLGLLVYFTYISIASEFRLAFNAPSTWLILFLLVIFSLCFSITKKKNQEI